jgi:hypothetical protein
MDLDEFDRRLLEALQHNSHEIGEELAKLTHLSPAACLRRAKRLRDEGIILAARNPEEGRSFFCPRERYSAFSGHLRACLKV